MSAPALGDSNVSSSPADDKTNSRLDEHDVEPETSDLEKNNPIVKDEAAKDPNIVDWDGDADPSNPMNWTGRQKLINIGQIIVLTLLTPLASSMFAPGVPRVLQEFHESSETLAEFVVSVYILGFAVGPLLVSPASEIYGRYPVYLICNIFFLIFTVACAVATNIAQLTTFRFFAGLFGVCPVTLGGASISDVITQSKRGVAMSLFGMGPLLGPVIGPICGSYLAEAKGWRWTFWVITIAYGLFTILHALFCKETYAPVILHRKTLHLQKETNNPSLRSKLDDGLPNETRIKRALIRPLRLLLTSPIVFFISLYGAFVYGILYMLYTTVSFIFQENYHFSEGNVGLCYIPSGIGMFIGLAIIGSMSDRILKAKAEKHDGELKPEYRLVVSLWVGWLVPVGMFIYGWTAQYREQWAVPLFGTLLFGVGIIAALINVSQYLIDAFTVYAASAIAAATLLRSLVGGLLPLAGLDLFQALGLGWGNSLMGFIALALVPIPFAFYVWGERLRKRFPVKF